MQFPLCASTIPESCSWLLTNPQSCLQQRSLFPWKFTRTRNSAHYTCYISSSCGGLLIRAFGSHFEHWVVPLAPHFFGPRKLGLKQMGQKMGLLVFLAFLFFGLFICWPFFGLFVCWPFCFWAFLFVGLFVFWPFRFWAFLFFGLFVFWPKEGVKGFFCLLASHSGNGDLRNL